MSKPKLALIPSGYKGGDGEGTVYSILPNDASGDFDYERNGNATRVRKDGLIEELTVDDTPRLDWLNSNCPSLLLEPQRTNILQRSEEFDNSYWTKERSSITANKIIAPNGELTADQFFDSTDNNSHLVYRSINITNGVNYSFSCFMKKGTLTKGFLAFNSNDAQTVVFDLENGIVESQGVNIDSSSIEKYNNDWYKCSFTHTSTSTTFLYRVGTYDGGITYTGTGTDYIYIWGAMLEQASYSSSYIKTEGTSLTRLKDDLQDLNNVDLINSVEGVFYAEIRAFKSEAVFKFITLNDGTSSNSVRIYLYNRIYARLLVGGVEQCIFNTTDYDVTEFNKIAFLYSPNNFKLFINGVLIGADTSGSTFANETLTTLSFDRGDNSFRFDGAVKDLRVYNTTLTDNELIELTK